ncbi:hypothetical protein ACLRAJ_17150 [Bordetella avium]|uniref:hypothetical protein n=1 Tax=Bordetella avium TaxID=521 RepID=UPI0039FD1A50
MMRLLAALFVTAALAGCVSSGVRVKDEQLSAFVPGQMTTQEVIASLGQPTTQMRNADGTSMLMYSYVEAKARPASYIPFLGAFVGGADSSSNMVQLHFDAAGKLVQHSSSQSNYGTGTGYAAGSVDSVPDQPRRP